MLRDTEWDPYKASLNRRKHGVSFAEAVMALEDPLALTREDDHPAEMRFVTVGLDARSRILIVVWALRGARARIISARLATPGERRQYAEGD